jgi:sulfate transport system substrate-binding protein
MQGAYRRPSRYFGGSPREGEMATGVSNTDDRRQKRRLYSLIFVGLVGLGCGACSATSPADKPSGETAAVKLINVSYDPTRELYDEFNKAFAKHWKEEKGQDVALEQSHGGSGKQARSVIDGLEADIVTLALAQDVDEIAKTGLLPKDWQRRLPQNSAPYTSTQVFLVRKGNPKGIKDWNDLVKEGVQVVTPNPKTSGGARWAYLAAWGFALKANNNDEAKALEFVTRLYKNVQGLDPGARDSTTKFVQHEIGDVLLSWENEAFLAIKNLGGDKYEMITPSVSILAEPSVAIVDKNTEKHGTTDVAVAYLEYLYSPTGQQLAAKHFYRPRNSGAVDAETLKRFPKIKLFTIDEVFGGWAKATEKHFKDGGTFDAVAEAMGE